MTRQVQWVPPGIGLEERELDWLRNMRDWMISRSATTGLPCRSGSVRRARVGGDRLARRAPRARRGGLGRVRRPLPAPAVDRRGRDRLPACGGRSRRIADVGNPWLDAGIVAYSTLNWATEPDYWEEWFPADFHDRSHSRASSGTGSTPSTMSTVLTGQPPTRTLLGHALVRDARRRGGCTRAGATRSGSTTRPRRSGGRHALAAMPPPTRQ